MKRSFLGFTFLLAAFFPIGGELFQGIVMGPEVPFYRTTPQIFLNFLTLFATYAPAALATVWFFKIARLSERVPSSYPGGTIMLVGVLLILAHTAVVFFAHSVPGGGASFTVRQLAPLMVIPARILLVIGAAKFLLSAHPSNNSLKSDAAKPRTLG